MVEVCVVLVDGAPAGDCLMGGVWQGRCLMLRGGEYERERIAVDKGRKKGSIGAR